MTIDYFSFLLFKIERSVQIDRVAIFWEKKKHEPMLNRKKSKLFLEMFNYAQKQIVHILLPENSKAVNMVACNGLQQPNLL